MTNFDADAIRVFTGWIGYYQLPNRADRTYVNHEGDRLIFASKQEAISEAHKAFMAALNRSLIGGAIGVMVNRPEATSEADSMFPGLKPIRRNGKVIPVEKIERKGAAA